MLLLCMFRFALLYVRKKEEGKAARHSYINRKGYT